MDENLAERIGLVDQLGRLGARVSLILTPEVNLILVDSARNDKSSLMALYLRRIREECTDRGLIPDIDVYDVGMIEIYHDAFMSSSSDLLSTPYHVEKVKSHFIFNSTDILGAFRDR